MEKIKDIPFKGSFKKINPLLMIHEIAFCTQCPFWAETKYHDEYCSHPSADEENSLELDDENSTILPDWCPLKIEPITIKLNQ